MIWLHRGRPPRYSGALLGLALLSAPAAAQDAGAAAPSPAPTAPTAPTAPLAEPATEPVADTTSLSAATSVTQAAPAPAVIPAGTTIAIMLGAPVSSRTAKQGDVFPIVLVDPIRLGDRDIVPAGIRGEGQVVHAAPRGFGGRAGELIVAARYLQWGDHRLYLRGMRVSRAGRDNATAALVTTAALSIAGFFVTGTSVDLPEGQYALARLADPLPVPDGPDSEAERAALAMAAAAAGADAIAAAAGPDTAGPDTADDAQPAAPAAPGPAPDTDTTKGGTQ